MFSKDNSKKLFENEWNENELEIKINQNRKEISNNEKVISNGNRQLATIEMEMKQMEMSDDTSKIAFLYEMERNKLNELAEKWSILKVAHTTLQEAKSRFQETYLTEVIKVTAHYFSHLTKGKYKQIFAPTTTKLFQVEASNNMRYTVDELSKGTIDQLYISLRLAISKVMSEKFVIPLIIDDAFVHFDDDRTIQIIDLLKKISATQQVLLFTCKKEIASNVQATHILDDYMLTN